MTRRTALGCLSGLAASGFARAQAWVEPTAGVEPTAWVEPTKDEPTVLRAGGGAIEVAFSSDQFDLPRPALLAWIDAGARAVSGYFGRFPVSHARVQVVMTPGRRRISGVSWGDGGAHSRITVPQHATELDLQRDWVMTHEMVHYGFPSVDAEHHWMEEGSATYIEPIARAAVGNLPVAQVWSDMVRDMPQGLPGTGDQGLDHTHSWGRTYWGGALFCLLADVGIRRRSRNKKGLVDALRAVNRAGGNIVNDWPLEHALQVGDKATGGRVLTTLYGQMAAQPMPVDLPELWRRLGVKREGGQVTFDDGAPLAGVRAAIC